MAIAIPLPGRGRRADARAACRRCWRWCRAALIVIVVYLGCMLWTVRLSFTSSKLLPKLDFVGFDQYARLFEQRALPGLDRRTSSSSASLFLIGAWCSASCSPCSSTSACAPRASFRTIYLYPHAMSFIVTGLAWQWFLNPTLGLQKLVHDLGLAELHLRLARQPADGGLHAGDRRRCGSPPG